MFEAARRVFLQALQFATNSDDTVKIATSYLNLGNAEAELGEDESAKKNYTHALTKLGVNISTVITDGTIDQIAKHDPDREKKETVAHSLSGLGRLAHREDEFETAYLYLDKAFVIISFSLSASESDSSIMIG